MNEALIRIAAFGVPATLGLVAALIGAPTVRRLRRQTGDDSTLTRVLGLGK